jgi:hypothetical protein
MIIRGGSIIGEDNSKAQVALEFLAMVGFAMLIVIIFLGVIYYLSFKYSEDKNINRLMDLGYSLQNELILASEVELGYERTIFIPDKVDKTEYNISQSTHDLIIEYKGTMMVFAIPDVTGTFTKGNNTIRKTLSGTVTIS